MLKGSDVASKGKLRVEARRARGVIADDNRRKSV